MTRNKVGLFLIVSQFSLVIFVFMAYLLDGYNFDEMTTTVAIIFPMLSMHTTGIIKHFISNREQEELPLENFTKEFQIITWLIPSLFIIGLGIVIIIKPLNGFDNFEDFKTTLAVIESVFGVFTGYIVSALLEK